MTVLQARLHQPVLLHPKVGEVALSLVDSLALQSRVVRSGPQSQAGPRAGASRLMPPATSMSSLKTPLHNHGHSSSCHLLCAHYRPGTEPKPRGT